MSSNRLIAILLLISISISLSGCSTIKSWLNKGKKNTSQPVANDISIQKPAAPLTDTHSQNDAGDEVVLTENEVISFEVPSVDNVKKDEVNVSLSSIKKNNEENSFLSDEYKGDIYNSWIKYYTGRGRELFQRHLNNGDVSREIVYSILNQYDLPLDLYYIGLIESGYNTHIRSHASAVGPWQFMKGTARGYDLIVNKFVDERVNIYKATEAAAKYFRDLYNIFGSWDLALCAYNSGENRVMNAIRRGKTRNLNELIQRKLLPRETRNYVPKLLAAKHISQNRVDYGFEKKQTYTEPEMDEFVIKHPTSIYKISGATGLKTDYIRKINPDIKGNVINFSSDESFTVYLPERYVEKLAQVGSSKLQIGSERFDRAIAEQKPKSVKRYHGVQKGETLIGISNRNNISLSALLRLNNMNLTDTIYAGQKLVVHAKKTADKYFYYKVKRGDNLSSLSEKFRIPVRTIKRINDLHSSQINVNSRLKIPAQRI